jgi:hypothetical protein
MRPRTPPPVLVLSVLLRAFAAAQTMPAMPGMSQPTTLTGTVLQHTSSGTSIEPASTPVQMWMAMHGNWMLMLHGLASVSGIFQHAATNTGPSPSQCALYGIIPCPTAESRAQSAAFSTNWIMPMAMRTWDPQSGPRQTLTLRTMLSLEPATVRNGSYPELFQQGETWNSDPIVDGQHPHDFVMELAALYDLELSKQTLLSFYAAPVGDPAIGPTAYPHRASAAEDPIAPLGHHQEDSTHIAFSVLTGGLTWKWFRFEESGFHGAEPDEHRWQFQPSPNGLAIDSYSSRLTIAPTKDWTGQYSWAHIVSPEQLYPGEDQQRQTASGMYSRSWQRDGIDATAVWGRTRSLSDNAKENSYVAELLWRFVGKNHLWTRIENAGRTSELLLQPGSPLPPGFEEQPIGHVAACSLGYDHDFPIAPHLAAAPGAQFSTYLTPEQLVSTYGSHPFGAVVFVRFRILSK